MNVRDLQNQLALVVPDARIPDIGPADDLYPFRWASAAFVPPFMDAVVRVVLGADDEGTGRARLVALAELLEEVFVRGDDVADALAMRLIHTRLCAQPTLLAGVWPYLGPRTRRVAGKFLRLAEECDRREAAARGATPPAAAAAPPSRETALAPSA